MSESLATLFQRLTQGVYVVGVAHEEVRNAFTAAHDLYFMTLFAIPTISKISIPLGELAAIFKEANK